ncbi:MAG: glyoxalase [Chloroflexia bacterium]|nr:glyoxalase [Chloroflexia bacterium]
MASGVKTFIYPVKDLDRAKSLFGALLGAEPTVDSPYYVQFEIGDQRLGLDPNGHTRGFPGSVGYWEVEDINARFHELLAAGATEHESVKDVGNGALIASVNDADGNVIGLIQPAQGQ